LNSERIKGVILQFLHERFDVSPAKVTDDTTLRDVGLDSMAMLEVMIELEDVLKIKMKDLTIPPNPSLRDVVAVVQRNLPASQ
jgi:acyl carrier protein